MKDVQANNPKALSYKNPEPRRREAYTPPVLHIYGSVSRLTMGATGTGPDGVMMTMVSDRTAKENIVRVGTHPLGIGLYLFDYKPAYRDLAGYGRKLGVMADEVEQIVPAAVLVHTDGYKMVDYALLAQAQAALAVH